MTDEAKVPEGVETDSREYWKFRARQWQKRCQRAEAEQTALIRELNVMRAALPKLDKIERHVSIRNGALGGTSGRPRGL